MIRALPLAVGGAVLLGVLAGFWVVYSLGHQAGVAQVERQLRAAEARYTARMNELSADLVAAQRARAELLRELEEAADADPDAGRPALGPDSVRRLNAIR